MEKQNHPEGLISRTQDKINSDEINSEKNFEVAFSGHSESYCVGLVDIIESTKISASLHEREWCRYYEIFLNSMAKILQRFGGVVIKNGGDSLLYYFPESSRQNSNYGLISCLECNLSMSESHDYISKIIQKEDLPSLNYRISSDFGKVVIMSCPNSYSIDLIGPSVNMSAKINNKAQNNGVVIGGDLYELVKGLPDYTFKAVEGFSVGLKFKYPVYQVYRKENGFHGKNEKL